MRNEEGGFSLLELMAATTISGLVVLAVVASARIGMRAWEKEQEAVLQLRRVTNVQDILQLQLSSHMVRTIVAELPNRRVPLPFFFAEERRLLGENESWLIADILSDNQAREMSFGSWSVLRLRRATRWSSNDCAKPAP